MKNISTAMCRILKTEDGWCDTRHLIKARILWELEELTSGDSSSKAESQQPIKVLAESSDKNLVTVVGSLRPLMALPIPI